MPETPFRLTVVGLLFIVVARLAMLQHTTEENFLTLLLGFSFWIIGCGFVIFGLLDWYFERKGKYERANGK